MEILKRSFKAKVTENKEQANGRVLRYLDMDNGAEEIGRASCRERV